MRTLHIGLRVSDLQRSLAFYQALGYEVVGTVPGTDFGDLTMLKLPEDEFVTIELVSSPPKEHEGEGPGLNHLVIKVDSIATAVSQVVGQGIDADEPAAPPEPNHPRTSWIADPDGNRIELVQWPVGHPDGLTAADWPDRPDSSEGQRR
jgi:lactoylglutathione lyase